MYSRYADLSERRSAQKKSGCKLNLQITRTTIVSAIAVSVAKANAVLFSRLLMSLGHTMDSNTDQPVAHGHRGVFVVGDFLRKGDVLMVTRIEGEGPSAIAKALKIGRASV
jgi:hypothetical protein